jgi:hypothetical protein
MDEVYEQVLRDMEVALDKLVTKVSPPQRVPFGTHFVFRYVEKTAQQAIVQKLARIITGLRAAHLLLKNGLIQEQAVICRVLWDLEEDVLFLSYGIMKSELETKWHKLYLDAFYEEEFDDPSNAFKSTQKRPMVSRRRIQVYLAAAGANDSIGNRSVNQEVARSIFKAVSGFVHAASPQIMDMYGGNPGHFHVHGMLGTPRMLEYERDIWNYFERGMAVFSIAAITFGDQELVAWILSQKKQFERLSGRDN